MLKSILISLGLGTLINIAVGWYAAHSQEHNTTGFYITASTEPAWLFSEGGNWGTDSVSGNLVTIGRLPSANQLLDSFQVKSPPAWSRTARIPADQAIELPSVEQDWIELRHGWPLRSLTCSHQAWNNPPAGATPFTRGALVLKGTVHRNRGYPEMLPFHIVPLGFAVNSILYGFLVLIGLSLFRLGRRTTRKAAGKCTRCSYILESRERPCPECGTEPV